MARSLPLLLFFLFLLSPLRLTTPAHLSETPGSHAASSRSSANSSACVRVCVLCVQSRLATPRARCRGVGAATAHRRHDGNSATRLCFDVQASKAPPWLGRERARVHGGPAAAWSGDGGGLQHRGGQEPALGLPCTRAHTADTRQGHGRPMATERGKASGLRGSAMARQWGESVRVQPRRAKVSPWRPGCGCAHMRGHRVHLSRGVAAR